MTLAADSSPEFPKKEAAWMTPGCQPCETRAETQPDAWPTEAYKYYMQTTRKKTTKSAEEQEMNKCGWLGPKKLLNYTKLIYF